MSTSSSSAAEKNLILGNWIKILISFIILFIIITFIYLNKGWKNPYISKTLESSGSSTQGDALFKMNCVGCHGITARGLVGPDLHSVTSRLNDIEIIKQVTEGRTPPMPSFDIDPQQMANLLTYLHKLE